jgi:hypothetical protein
MKAKPQFVTVQTRRPMGDDPGAAERAFYVVEGDLVTLTDEKGEPLRRTKRTLTPTGWEPGLKWETKLGKDEDAVVVAKRLLLQRHRVVSKGSSFNRPLQYPASGVY